MGDLARKHDLTSSHGDILDHIISIQRQCTHVLYSYSLDTCHLIGGSDIGSFPDRRMYKLSNLTPIQAPHVDIWLSELRFVPVYGSSRWCLLLSFTHHNRARMSI
jgi:hypothetical protein